MIGHRSSRLHKRCCPRSGQDCALAAVTGPRGALVGYLRPDLENRLLAGIVAGCTKPMRRLAVLHFRLQGIRVGAGSNALKAIAGALCGPVFKARDLLFEIAFALNERRMVVLCHKQCSLGVDRRTGRRMSPAAPKAITQTMRSLMVSCWPLPSGVALKELDRDHEHNSPTRHSAEASRHPQNFQGSR